MNSRFGRLARHAIAVSLALAILPIGSAAAAGVSTVSGRVHAVGDASTGFSGVSVDLYDAGDLTDPADDMVVDSALTEDGGEYSFDLVGAGNYYVSSYDGEFLLPERFSGNVDEQGLAVPFAVDGIAPATADIAYTGVRGTITTTSANAFDQAHVRAYELVVDEFGDEYREVTAFASATSSGAYFLAVAPGAPRLEASVARHDPWSSSRTWSGGGHSYDSATPVTVGTAATETFDAHFTTISGAVSVPAGTSLDAVEVTAGVPLEQVETDGDETYTWWEFASVANASADPLTGVYELFVPPGSYAVEFGVWSDFDYHSYFHGPSSQVENAALVSPTADAGVEEVNGTFRSISGFVYDDAATPNPVADAYVSAVEPGSQDWDRSSTQTGADGAYTLLTWPGTFNVHASHYKHDCDLDGACTYEWSYETWHGGQRTPETAVDVSAASAADKNLAFRVIRGKVYEEGTDTPLGGIWVDAWDESVEQNYGWAETAPDGTYEIGVPSGSYTVSFSDYDFETNTGWTQYYDRVRSSSLATPVAIDADTSRSGIDGVKGPTLVGDSSISGTITAPSTVTSPDLSVWAYNYGNDEYYGPAAIDASGNYTLPVPAGEYYVEAYAYTSDDMMDGYFGKDVVALPDTGVDVDIDFQTVTGTVTMPADTFGSVRISTVDGSNGGWGDVREDGTYTALAPAGSTYYARFSAWHEVETLDSWSYGSGRGYSGGAPGPASAQTFAVPASNVNHRFNLITGSVTDSAGNALPDSSVSVFNTGVTEWTEESWDEERGWAYGLDGGTYAIPMSAGQYKVQFWSYLNDEWDVSETEWFDNKTSYSTADVVTVGATTDRPGVDGTFDRGGITGTVTAADTGAALPNVCVTAWDGATKVASATTRSDGKYTLYANAGSYTLKFIHCVTSPTYKDQWFTGVESQTGATPVAIVGKTLTTGKNVTMQTGFVKTDPIVTTTTSGTNATTTYDPRTGQSTTTMPSGGRVDVTASYAPTCETGGVDATSVKLVHNGVQYSTTASGGVYTGTVPAANVTSGAISFTWTCSGSTTPTSTTVGTIQLYDPSGDVTDAKTGAAVKDATVTLYRIPGWEPKQYPGDTTANTCESNLSKSSTAKWSQTVTAANLAAAELADPESGMIRPTVNPQKTNSVGRYGWDVAKGCWFVTVEKAGYHKHTSPLVGVPPEVTDLDVALQPVTTTTPPAPPPPAPSPRATTVTSGVKPAKIAYGKSAVFSGKLADKATGAGLGGRSVAVQIRTQKPNKTWTGWSKLASVTTSSTGGYTYTHKTAKNSQYRASFAKSGVYTASTSTARAVNVAAKATSKLSTTKVRVGKAAVFSGKVAPNLKYKKVFLQRKVGTKWRDITSKALSATSTFKFTAKPPKKGKFSYRLRIPAYAPYVNGLGPVKVLTAF